MNQPISEDRQEKSSATGHAQTSTATTRSTLVKTVSGVALSLLTGVLITLSFDPFSLWPLIAVAFVPMIVAQYRVLPAALSSLGPGIGIACLFAHQMSAGFSNANVAWYYQMWPVFVVLVIGILGWGGRAFHQRTNFRWFLVSFPAAWVGIEFLRALSAVDFLGGTWGNPTYALYEQFWFLQPLSIFGIFGLSFLLFLVNFAVARAAIVAIDRWHSASPASAPAWRQAYLPLSIALAVIIGWTVLSLALIDDAPGTLRVAAVQANAPGDADEEFRRDIEQTRIAAAEGARLVVWREGGLKFNPVTENTDLLLDLAADTDAFLAVGFRYDSEQGRHNEAVVLTPGGEIMGPYGKTHPGKFAGDLSTTGGRYLVYDTDIGPLATIICYDLDFTDTARHMARRGARIIAVPSADVPGIALTHYTHLVFRAIENRVPMIKSDNMFDSAIIDPWGRIITRVVNPLSVAEAKAAAASNSMAPQLLLADIPLGSGESLYVSFGDWFGWLAVLVMAGFLVFSISLRFRGKNS